MTLLDRIYEICDKKNISKIQLETATGIKADSLRKWNKSSPSIDKVLKIAEFLNVSIDYLMGRTTSTVIDESDPFISSIIKEYLVMNDYDKKRFKDILKITFPDRFSFLHDNDTILKQLIENSKKSSIAQVAAYGGDSVQAIKKLK